YRRAMGSRTAKTGYDERVMVHKTGCRLRKWDLAARIWASRLAGGGVTARVRDSRLRRGARDLRVRGWARSLPSSRLRRLAGPAIGGDIIDDDGDMAQAGDERAVQGPGPGGQLTLGQTGRELIEACVDRLDIGIGVGDGLPRVVGDIGPFGAEAVIPLALVVGGLGQGAGEIAQMGDALVDAFEDVLVADLRRGGDGGRMRSGPARAEVAARIGP